MAQDAVPSKMRSMLDMKLTVGQVLAGSFTTVITVVSTVIWVQGTFETKLDADKKERVANERMAKMESSFDSAAKLQIEIYGDVKEMHGILRDQTSSRSAHGGR